MWIVLWDVTLRDWSTDGANTLIQLAHGVSLPLSLSRPRYLHWIETTAVDDYVESHSWIVFIGGGDRRRF